MYAANKNVSVFIEPFCMITEHLAITEPLVVIDPSNSVSYKLLPVLYNIAMAAGQLTYAIGHIPNSII